MKSLIAISFILTTGCFGSPLPAAEIRAQKQGLEQWREVAERADDLPKSEAIEKLGEGIRKTARRDIYSIGGTNEVAQELRNALLAIPGHAEYYRDRILEVQKTRDEAMGKLEYSGKAGDYRIELQNAMATLEHLPSPETVRVLGDFLSDYSANPLSPQDNMKESPNCHHAVVALCHLPLMSKPANTKYGYEAADDLPAWQLWYEEIKSGKRTFRFEGDPTEYTLEGPAPKKTLERIARDQKRDAERVAGHTKTVKSSDVPESTAAPVSSKSLFVALLGSGMVLLISLGWYFVKARSR